MSIEDFTTQTSLMNAALSQLQGEVGQIATLVASAAQVAADRAASAAIAAAIERLLSPYQSALLAGNAITGSKTFWDFRNGNYKDREVFDLTLAADFTSLRASSALASDRDGNWSSFAVNAARVTSLGLHVHGAGVNEVRNSSCAGAVSPNTMPTGWQFQDLTGISKSWSAPYVENGVKCVDLRLFGTSVPGGKIFQLFGPYTDWAASQNNPFCNSAFVRMKAVGTQAAGVKHAKLYSGERTSAGALPFSQSGPALPLANAALGLGRRTFSGTVFGSTIAFLQPGLEVEFLPNIAADMTLTIGFPQGEPNLIVSAPIDTNGAEGARAAEFYSYAEPGTPQGAFLIDAVSASAKGVNQCYFQHDDLTDNNRWRVYRDTAGSLWVSAIRDGVETIAVNTGDLADSTPFYVYCAYTFSGVIIIRDGASVFETTGLYPKNLARVREGSGIAGEHCFSPVLRSAVYPLKGLQKLPAWQDGEASVIQDFRNARWKNLTDKAQAVVRSTGHIQYDILGKEREFSPNQAAWPCYHPESHEPLGIGIFTSTSVWCLNQRAPVTQTMLNLPAGSWSVYAHTRPAGLGSGTGSVAISGATSGNGSVAAIDPSGGFVKAQEPGKYLHFLNSAPQSVTITPTGDVDLYQVEQNGSAAGAIFYSFPSPPLKVTSFALARQYDSLEVDTTLYPGRYDLDWFTHAVAYYVTDRSIERSWTILGIQSGRQWPSLAHGLIINGKSQPQIQPGVTVLKNGVQLGGVDPADNVAAGPLYAIKQGWNFFVLAYRQSTGQIRVCSNGGAIVGVTGSNVPAAGALRYLYRGAFLNSNTTLTQLQNGWYGAEAHFKGQILSDARMQALGRGEGYY
jgi:hypothetical protein